MTWKPLTSRHAIERVRLVVEFTENVPVKILKAMSEQLTLKRHDLRMVGPKQMQSFGIRITPTGPDLINQADRPVQGWQFTRNAANGAPLEAITCDAETVLYETAEYQRWEQFKRRAERIVVDIIEAASAAVDVRSMSVEYFDRFYFAGNPLDAEVALLLNDEGLGLHPDAASGKSLWHLHRGWFHEVEAGDRALINQNFDAQEGSVQGSASPVRSVAILTKAELRSSECDLDVAKFSENLEMMHKLTKMYFKGAIRAELHETVGM